MPVLNVRHVAVQAYDGGSRYTYDTRLPGDHAGTIEPMRELLGLIGERQTEA